MATPVLLTVGVLGAGWVYLSRKRAQMAGTASMDGEPTAGDAPAQGPGGMEAAAAFHGPTPIGANNAAFSPAAQFQTKPTIDNALVFYDSSQNPNTSPSDGGNLPSTAPSAPATTNVDGPVTAAFPQVFNKIANSSTLVYGSQNGVTRSQQAQALATIGPMSGMVW